MLQSESVGLRVARLRRLAGLTQEQLAQSIGRTRGHVGHIENGRVVPNAALLVRIAAALGTTVDQLRPDVGPSSDVLAEWHVHELVPHVRAALDGVLQGTGRDMAALRHLTIDLHAARMACDYRRLAELLPPLLADGVHLVDRSDDPRAADLLVRACVAGAIALRPVGYHDLSVRLADVAARAAGTIDDPVLRGAADYVLAQTAHASGLEAQRRRSLALATAAAARLESSRSHDAMVWYGMSHLQAALSAAALGDLGAADTHLAEAHDVARTSPRDSWVQEFSVPNVSVWRLAVYLQAGDLTAAYGAARTADREGLRTRHRRARFALDAARAYQGAGQPERSVTALLHALDISPAEIRSRPTAHDLVANIVASGRADPRLPHLLSRLPSQTRSPGRSV